MEYMERDEQGFDEAYANGDASTWEYVAGVEVSC